MQLTAKTRIVAHLDGRDIRLDAGEAFSGTEREARRLLALGLVEGRRQKRKEGANER